MSRVEVLDGVQLAENERHMKWPSQLTLVRHGQSKFNELKEIKKADPRYQEFRAAFEDPQADPEEVRALAQALMDNPRFILNVSDADTPLSETGKWQSKTAAEKLSLMIDLPDVIYVSPYLRTRETLESMTRGWKELAGVPVVIERRIREREHGRSILYSDNRIFQALHPEEKLLRERQGTFDYQYPGGESVPDIQDRLRSWISTLIRENAQQKVMAITHHLALLAFRSLMERFDAEEFTRIDQEEKPVNAGVTIYRGDPDQGKQGKLVLEEYNANLYE